MCFADWEGGVGEIPGGVGTRTVYAWHASNKLSTSVAVVSTIASVEFTALGSFGTPYGFAFTNVARLDRRSRKRDTQIADLVGAASQCHHRCHRVSRPRRLLLNDRVPPRRLRRAERLLLLRVHPAEARGGSLQVRSPFLIHPCPTSVKRAGAGANSLEASPSQARL